MAKISTYPDAIPPALDDFLIGTDISNANATKSFLIADLRTLIIAGLSPEIGGTFKTTEIEILSLDTDIATTVNALSPSYIVEKYEQVWFNVDGLIYVLKLVDLTIGTGGTTLTNDDFIIVPANTGPTGPTGPTGNGIASIALLSTVGLVDTYRITYTNATTFDYEVTNGQDSTSNNLQRTVTASFSLSNSDNNYTIIINNDVTAITITVPSGLITKFACGFIQQGTADVTFDTGVGVTINTAVGVSIKGQNYACLIEQVTNSNVFQLVGDLKTV